VIDLHQESVNA